MAEIEPAELARLARLELPTATGEQTAAEVRKLLGFFSMLQEVDTDGVAPSAYPLPIEARPRPDVPEPPLSREDVLRNAPLARGGCFVVPRVVEG